MSSSSYSKTSKQIKEYFLCQGCEQKFNRNGELWVLKNYCQTDGTFPIKERLIEAAPFFEEKFAKFYNGSDVLGNDIDSLSYFAISVFWRAAAREWKPMDAKIKLSLGRNEEMLRQYLLNKAPFHPKAVLLIYVDINVPDGALMAPLPCDESTYFFSIPGIGFILLLGDNIPLTAYDYCAINSSNRVLTLGNIKGLTRGIPGKMYKNHPKKDKF